MTLYNVFYKGDSNGNPPCYEATTDNFEKWLKDYNSNREKDFQESADNFEVEDHGYLKYQECFSQDQYVSFGRNELAENLLELISKWEYENE